MAFIDVMRWLREEAAKRDVECGVDYDTDIEAYQVWPDWFEGECCVYVRLRGDLYDLLHGLYEVWEMRGYDEHGGANERKVAGPLPFQKALETMLDHARRMVEAVRDPDEGQDPESGEPHALQRYDLDMQEDGTVIGTCWTNDNEDRGYPNETASWPVRYRSWEEAVERTGKSHVGCSGVVVEVYLDGEKI